MAIHNFDPDPDPHFQYHGFVNMGPGRLILVYTVYYDMIKVCPACNVKILICQ